MTPFTLIILALSVLAVLATVHEISGGGRGHAPRSHEEDTRFLPPGACLG